MNLGVGDGSWFASTGGRPFDPDQPVVALVHGAGLDHTMWALTARGLAAHGRSVLAVDLPGHGRSDGPPVESVEAAADWVIDLVGAAGVEQVAVAGHSLGALIALSAASRHPDRVRALALLGAALELRVHPQLLAAAEAGDALAFDLMVDWLHTRRTHLGASPVPGRWMSGSTRRLLEQAGPGVLGIDLRATDSYRGGAEAAALVACPAVVILGEGDRMVPVATGTELAEALPDAQLVVLPDCGHMMTAEQPDAVLAILRQVL